MAYFLNRLFNCQLILLNAGFKNQPHPSNNTLIQFQWSTIFSHFLCLEWGCIAIIFLEYDARNFIKLNDNINWFLSLKIYGSSFNEKQIEYMHVEKKILVFIQRTPPIITPTLSNWWDSKNNYSPIDKYMLELECK